jgi:hypothetical protein
MERWRKNPRTLRLNQAKAQVEHIEQLAEAHEAEKQTQVAMLQHNFKELCEAVFGFTPCKYQLELAKLFENNQFTAVRWSRQTGKSFSVSALILKYALEHPDSYIAIVGPSWRQTKLNIRRIGGFSENSRLSRVCIYRKTELACLTGA